MCPVAVVTDSTSYLPPELIERERIGVVPLYVVFGGDRTVPEVEITDYPAFFEELRSAEKLPTTSQPSVGDFTAIVRAAAGRRQRDRVRAHLGRALRHARGGAPGEGCALARRQGRRAHRGRRLDDRRRRARLHGARGGEGGARRREREGGRRARGAGAQGAPALVRDRHARVPEARRPDRRRQRMDRLDAQGEADPHRRERDDPGRASADVEPDVRAPGRVRARVRGVGRRRVVRAAHQRTGPVRRARSSAAPRSTATARPSSARSARSSRPTRDPGCSGPARCRAASWTSPLQEPGRAGRIRP